MFQRDVLRGPRGRFEIGRFGLQVRRVELEIRRPAPAGVFVAIDHNVALGPTRLDKEHVAVAYGGAVAHISVRPEDRIIAKIDALFIGVGDPHDIDLRQRIVKEPGNDQPDHAPKGPFDNRHRRFPLIKVGEVDGQDDQPHRDNIDPKDQLAAD